MKMQNLLIEKHNQKQKSRQIFQDATGTFVLEDIGENVITFFDEKDGQIKSKIEA